MKLETLVINGMKIRAFVSEKEYDGGDKNTSFIIGGGRSYVAIIGKQRYICQKRGRYYGVVGDNLRKAQILDEPDPETGDNNKEESKEDDKEPDVRPGLDRVIF